MSLNPQYLAEAFEYEPGTGLLYRRSTGKSVGTITSHGYLVAQLGKRHRGTEYVHRIAWILMQGSIAKGKTIDHRNGIGTDNRWFNLRLASQIQQNGNRRLEKTNKSGRRGVYWRPLRRTTGCWVATGSENNKSVCLGHFTQFEDAVAAREKWEAKHFGEFYATRQLQPESN